MFVGYNKITKNFPGLWGGGYFGAKAAGTIFNTTAPAIGYMGDSRTNYNTEVASYSTGANGYTMTEARGAGAVTAALFPHIRGIPDGVYIQDGGVPRNYGGTNVGVSGQDTVYMRNTELPKIIAANPPIVIIHGGINNGGLSQDPANPSAGDIAAMADLAYICTTLKATACAASPTGFMIPILSTVVGVGAAIGTPSTATGVYIPKGAIPSGTGSKANPGGLNGLIRAYCAANNVLLCDKAAQYAPDDTYVPAADQADGLHNNFDVGGWLEAQADIAILSTLISTSVPDWFYAVGLTNLMSNPTLSGTTGTKSGNVTGTVPTNITVSCPNFGTVTTSTACSIGVDPLGNPALILIITPGTTASDPWSETAITWNNTLSGTAGTLTGNCYQFCTQISYDACATAHQVNWAQNQAFENGGSARGAEALIGSNFNTDFLNMSTAKSLTVRTSSVKLDASGTSIATKTIIRVNLATTTPVKFYLALPKLAQVTDPSTLYPNS